MLQIIKVIILLKKVIKFFMYHMKNVINIRIKKIIDVFLNIILYGNNIIINLSQKDMLFIILME